jgi:hypothetical protein
MHIITVAFGATPAMWQFIFKNEESAEKAWLDINKAGRVTITDDFGQKSTFDTNNIVGRMIENMDLSKQAQVQRGLHQQRTQAEFQKAAETDPVIRMAMRGPAVLSPMQGFNGRGN